MTRASRWLGVLALSLYLVGCGSETVAPPTPAEDSTARATAAKMPPPPNTKPLHKAR